MGTRGIVEKYECVNIKKVKPHNFDICSVTERDACVNRVRYNSNDTELHPKFLGSNLVYSTC